MRILILSDLHLETRPIALPIIDADMVVLAGDIDNGVKGIEWAKQAFGVPVLYVAGNHEYYDDEFHGVQRSLREAASGSRVTVLDCEELVRDSIRFLGCSLWTDYSLVPPGARADTIELARRKNPDHQFISMGERKFSPEDAIDLCHRHRAWLTSRLAEPFKGRTVVITHFAPHPGSIAPQFSGHPANPGFIVDLDELMGKADLWIHGHTHTAFDYQVKGTRILSNPRGYEDENTGFRMDRIINISNDSESAD
jgi:predicted phosphodiesterase